MTRLKDCPSWLPLVRHRRMMDGLSLPTLFERDPHRFSRFSLELDGLLLDYSKNRITRETLELLTRLAGERGLEEARAALFAGEALNVSEQRPALHTALRAAPDEIPDVPGIGIREALRACRERLEALVDEVRSGARTGATGEAITDVVNIGIGGSDLGPRLAVEALAPWADGPRIHFVANVDGVELEQVMARLDPARTLFVVVSKSFGTPETMTNADQAMAWIRERLGGDAALARHVVPITANTERVAALGLDPELALPLWDWVGGRYSLWSAVGLTVALALGNERFAELLAGARAVDEHFLAAPLENNAPVLLGLLDVWYGTLHGYRSLAVVPYAERLARLPAYLQQLMMESNGKSVTTDGEAVEWTTAPSVWGLTGTIGQHAFFQALHQGTDPVPVDFVGVAAPMAEGAGDQAQLLANMLAQSRALMTGRAEDPEDDPARRAARACPGERPSNTILLRRLDPAHLGMLIALYEHRTFVEGVVWGVNSFDQWGVELGKEIARELQPALTGGELPETDASTRGLIDCIRGWGDPDSEKGSHR